MKNETKRAIRRMGIFLFVVYVLLLLYFLFFSEAYGRVAEAEREYRYNLVPFVEIRRFWVYRDQLGLFALFHEHSGQCDRIHPVWIYPSCYLPEVEKRLFDRPVGILPEPLRGIHTACHKGRLF